MKLAIVVLLVLFSNQKQLENLRLQDEQNEELKIQAYLTVPGQ